MKFTYVGEGAGSGISLLIPGPEWCGSVAELPPRACTLLNAGETLGDNIDLIPELVEDLHLVRKKGTE